MKSKTNPKTTAKPQAQAVIFHVELKKIEKLRARKKQINIYRKMQGDLFMAIYYANFKIIGRARGKGGSAVAGSAYVSGSVVAGAVYRAGEKARCEYDGKTHDYTHKTGIVHAEIMLPENAPSEFSDRETLWNAVEKKNKRKDAQLARECTIALPREFDLQEQIEVAREYVRENFTDKGICADFAIHDKGDGNPHFHVMFTMDKVTQDGFSLRLDEEKPDKYHLRVKRLEEWRESWARVCNRHLEARGLDERIDHRTLEEQGIDRKPTIHLGKEAFHLEKRGVKTALGDRNREIIKDNLTKTKEKYIDLTRKINEAQKAEINSRETEQYFKNRLDDIQTQRIELTHMEHELLKLRQERENMGVLQFAQKKEIDRQILALEKTIAREQRRADERGRDEISIKSKLQTTQEYWIITHQEQIERLQELRAETEFDYKRWKISAELHYFFRNGELEEGTEARVLPSFTVSADEYITLSRAEKRLNTITEKEYMRITGHERETAIDDGRVLEYLRGR